MSWVHIDILLSCVGLFFADCAEHMDEENNFWLSSESSLATRETKSSFIPIMKKAKIVLQRLNIRRTPARYDDCHKALQGSSFRYSLGRTAQYIVMKCEICKKDGTRASSELQRRATDTEEDVLQESTNHPPLHGTSRTFHNVQSSDSGREGIQAISIYFSFLQRIRWDMGVIIQNNAWFGV